MCGTLDQACRDAQFYFTAAKSGIHFGARRGWQGISAILRPVNPRHGEDPGESGTPELETCFSFGWEDAHQGPTDLAVGSDWRLTR